MCNSGRGHYKEHFCEIILNLDKWFRRCNLKDVLSTALVAYAVCANLVEGIIGIISLKLF